MDDYRRRDEAWREFTPTDKVIIAVPGVIANSVQDLLRRRDFKLVPVPAQAVESLPLYEVVRR